MVDIPYHTHTFDIPTASEGEIRAGIEPSKAITPDRLFPVLADKADKATTLAGYGIVDAATKDQGEKASTAVQPEQVSAVGFSGRYNDLLNKPDLGGSSGLNVGTTAGTVAAGDDSRIVNAVQKATTVSAGAGLAGGGTLAANVALALSSTSLASLALADTAVQPSVLLAYATKAELTSGLAGKSDTGHKHPISDVNGLQAALDAKAATVHTHTIAQVAGLQAALDGKATADQGAKADSAVQPAEIAGFATKAELTAGLGTKLGKTEKAADSALLNGQTSAQITAGFATQSELTNGLNTKLGKGEKAADSALLNGQTAAQFLAGYALTSSLGALATKSKIDVSDINATGTASAATTLHGDGEWRVPSGGGGGGMDPTVYDPRAIGADVFSMASMTEAPNALKLTDAERAAIAANTAARHSHGNKTVLDATTASFTTAAQTKLAGIPADADKTPALAAVATSGSYNDLANKPAIPAAQVASDWNAASGVTAIANKPALAAVATTGAYGDLSGRPTIPAAQAQTDWNAASGISSIANKPSSFPPSTHTHTKDQVGLGNADNTSDANKPVSSQQQTALDLKLDKNAQAADSAKLNGKTEAQLIAAAKKPDYVSASTAWAANALTSVAHGLGTVPSNVQVNLVCKVAAGGFAVGDEILFFFYEKNFDGSVSATFMTNATEVTVSVKSSIYGSNKAGTGDLNIVPANFNIIVRAWL